MALMSVLVALMATMVSGAGTENYAYVVYPFGVGNRGLVQATYSVQRTPISHSFQLQQQGPGVVSHASQAFAHHPSVPVVANPGNPDPYNPVSPGSFATQGPLFDPNSGSTVSPYPGLQLALGGRNMGGGGAGGPTFLSGGGAGGPTFLPGGGAGGPTFLPGGGAGGPTFLSGAGANSILQQGGGVGGVGGGYLGGSGNPGGYISSSSLLDSSRQLSVSSLPPPPPPPSASTPFDLDPRQRFYASSAYGEYAPGSFDAATFRRRNNFPQEVPIPYGPAASALAAAAGLEEQYQYAAAGSSSTPVYEDPISYDSSSLDTAFQAYVVNGDVAYYT